MSIDQALLGWGKAVEQRLRHALMLQQLAHLHAETGFRKVAGGIVKNLLLANFRAWPKASGDNFLFKALRA